MPASTILLRSLFLFLTLFLCTRKSRVFELNDDDGKKIRFFFHEILSFLCDVCTCAYVDAFVYTILPSALRSAPFWLALIIFEHQIWFETAFFSLLFCDDIHKMNSCLIACTLVNIIYLQVVVQANFGLAFSYRIPFNSNVQLFW